MKLKKLLVDAEKLVALQAEELEAGQNHGWLCLYSVCFVIVPHSGDSKYEFQGYSLILNHCQLSAYRFLSQGAWESWTSSCTPCFLLVLSLVKKLWFIQVMWSALPVLLELLSFIFVRNSQDILNLCSITGAKRESWFQSQLSIYKILLELKQPLLCCISFHFYCLHIRNKSGHTTAWLLLVFYLFVSLSHYSSYSIFVACLIPYRHGITYSGDWIN